MKSLAVSSQHSNNSVHHYTFRLSVGQTKKTTGGRELGQRYWVMMARDLQKKEMTMMGKGRRMKVCQLAEFKQQKSQYSWKMCMRDALLKLDVTALPGQVFERLMEPLTKTEIADSSKTGLNKQ
ncbi:hypothetical protein Pmani_009986 [Petrolisthes manimaculis]|uniref:Uncharacterized protein n=1 Tax=Petrolisthes manimaculis TaxID=1843537 RepID=A0AAE1Q2E0_9EUCA|nr:hypothetical protein Pmani_009986 [Petrolisthes manimaculis]